MFIGVYGDCHLNKNMRSFQDVWNVTASKSIYHMYDKFDELGVELAVCLGDFLDTPRLEAKDLSLVLPILSNINERSYPTYILLGNHESYGESGDCNILEYLRVYENIHPVTASYIMEDMCFIPYYEDPVNINMDDRIVFTHHDIYGSALASGKTSAFFGIDPKVFSRAKLVLNGHVHLKSKVCNNVVNAGSLLISQQGELKVGEYPSYYTVDTRTGKYETYDNEHSMIYLTLPIEEVGEVVQSGYDQMHTVLKVEYSGELPDSMINTLHTSYKKILSSIEDTKSEVVRASSFDMKNYLVEYIKKDKELSDDLKEDYIKTGVELLQ